MEFHLILSFIGASILLTLMPGPDNIFVLTQSLSKGYKTGIAISVGLISGLIVHTTLAATGLAILILQSEFLFSILQYLGAGYLFYLAYQASREKQTEIEWIGKSKVKEAWFPLVKKGFLMNVLNPKVSMFFIAFLPQFISEGGYHITLQMLILGLIFMAQALVIFSMLSVLSGRFSIHLNKPKFWTYTKWSKVIVLFILGLSLVIS